VGKMHDLRERQAGLFRKGLPSRLFWARSPFLASRAGAGDGPLPPPAQGTVDFLRDVRPIFESRCVECHGPVKQRGKLRLDSVLGVRKGGASGEVVLAAGARRAR